LIRNPSPWTLAGLASVLLLAFPGAAQDEVRCNPEGSNVEMSACAQDAYKKADRRLNGMYQRLLKSLADGDKEFGASDVDSRVGRLKEAQRAWIIWRDAECPLRSVSNFGGSIQSLTIPACLEKLTLERVRQLELVLKDQ
jgi:uncharacterized protein YecT (DUF1311 family)